MGHQFIGSFGGGIQGSSADDPRLQSGAKTVLRVFASYTELVRA